MSKAFWKKAAAAVSVIALSSGVLTGALANAGPPHELSDGDVVFMEPVADSQVEIVSENLSYGMSRADGGTLVADVIARYVMRNTDTKASRTLVAFVMNNSTRPPDILFNGVKVEIIRTEVIDWSSIYPPESFSTDRPSFTRRDWHNYDSWKQFGVWEPTFREIMLYFGSGTVSPDFNPSGSYNLGVSLFEISFGPGETCELEVSYTERAAFITDNFGYSGGGGHNPRHQFYYLLEPARYWKGFSDLSITVDVPDGLKTEFSIEGFTQDGQTGLYSAHFDRLPEMNLEILVFESGKIETPDTVSSLWWMLIGAVVLLAAAAAVTVKLLRKITRTAKVKRG